MINDISEDVLKDPESTFIDPSAGSGNFLVGLKNKLMEYHEEHPDDLIIFNANVLILDYGKVWYGDLNLTEDYLVLRDIAQSLDTTLYVLWEMDARFGEEMKPLNELLDKAVWNTTEDNPTKEWYKKKMDNKYKEMQMKGNDI